MKKSPQETLKNLVKRNSSIQNQSSTSIEDKVNETLFHLNNLKNAQTVKTSEFEAITQLYSGQLIYLDTRDASIAPHLMFRGHWEEHTSKVIRALLNPGDTFFDIGANFAYFSLLAGAEVEPTKTQIHVFEPNPELIPLIEKSMSVNGYTQYAKINQVAVASKPGKLRLNRITNLWGGSTIHDLDTLKKYRPIEDTFDAHFDVDAITIDGYVKENKPKEINLVKIDVEGVEDQVYQGMAKTIKSHPEMKIFLEFTAGAYEDAKGLFAQIKKDFKYLYAVPEENGGEFTQVNTMKELVESTKYELVMVLLTNEEM